MVWNSRKFPFGSFSHLSGYFIFLCRFVFGILCKGTIFFQDFHFHCWYICSRKLENFQVKGLLKDKKLETLVDADLQGDYIEVEVEELIRVALLCTDGAAAQRPKMSEVVRMLEGDGLAERWEQWEKDDIIRQEYNHIPHPDSNWIDSTAGLRPDELSGPRWSFLLFHIHRYLFSQSILNWKPRSLHVCI